MQRKGYLEFGHTTYLDEFLAYLSDDNLHIDSIVIINDIFYGATDEWLIKEVITKVRERWNRGTGLILMDDNDSEKTNITNLIL